MTVEVLIAGAGPVGLALANLLGGYGHRVLVVESRDELIDYPRGVGLDDESFRSLQMMGLAEEAIPYTVPHHIMRLVNGHGEVILTNNPQGEPYGWPRKFGFLQPEVDRVMFEGLARHEGVEVRFGHTLVGLDDRGEKVVATIETGDGSMEVTADFVVGCEGGRSFTRSWLGVDFEGASPSTRWVVIDVNNDPLGVPNVYLGADPARPYVSIGLPHAVRRWEFMLFDDEPSERVEDDDFVAELLADHVPDSSRLEVIRRRVFTHHGRIASSFRKGRVLIAGDAAHLMPVWLGQGWNSGMRDATNLAWKLASVLDGQASPGILDSYDEERRDHAKAMIDLSMTMGTIIKPTDRRIAFVRDLASRVLNLSPAVKDYFTDMRFKPIPRYRRGIVIEPDTLTPGRTAEKRISRFRTVRNAVDRSTPVGLPFIQPRVNTATACGVRLDDVLGSWWAVAAWGNDPARLLSTQSRDWLARIGARFVCFTSESQRTWAENEFDADTLVVGDLDGSLKSWFDTRAMGMVLLRPDRFVAAACLAQDGDRAVAALRGLLGGGDR